MSLYVFTSVYITFIGMIISAIAMTWTTPMLNRFNSTDLDNNPIGRRITSNEYDWLTSLPTLGACFGAVVYGILSSKFGRKLLIITTGFPYALAYFIMAWANNITLFYIARLAIGLAMGGSYILCPMYNGEIADAKNRGILGASFAVFVNIGLILPLITMPYMPWALFHILVGVLSILYIALLIFFIPESPYYLITKDSNAAREVLSKLRKNEDITNEYNEIQASINKSQESFINIISSKFLIKLLSKGYFGFVFLQLTGIMIVTGHSQRIFDLVDNSFAQEHGPLMISIAQLITTIVVSAVADKFPRKILLMLSYAGVSIVLIPFGLYFVLYDDNYDVKSYSWVPLLCLVLFVITYNIGVGPIMMTLLGEIFPTEAKGVSISILIIINWFHSFLLTQFFQPIERAIGMGYLFWFFSFASMLAILFVRFFIVETKGKTLQEIQDGMRY